MGQIEEIYLHSLLAEEGVLAAALSYEYILYLI